MNDQPNVERVSDLAARRHVELLAALLDHQQPPWQPGELPPLAHWLLFPPAARQAELGEDGHPAREHGGLPRRMWAGSRIRFIGSVGLGAELVRETTEIARTDKTGRSGRMQFVTLRHRFFVDDRLAIEEEQDIVYREPSPPGASARPPSPERPAPYPRIVRHIQADPRLLFRFSALTYNAHRIHYDRTFATGEEGWPGLVVHGPLLATLLMDLYLSHTPGARIAGFTFRALRPIFDIDPFTVGLEPDSSGGELVVIDAQRAVAMQARVDLQ